eukprot:scaffold7969_cov56-Attheya_sp.AAC.4
MMFDYRKDLDEGVSLLYKHFTRFGLKKLHIGRESKNSKSEYARIAEANKAMGVLRNYFQHKQVRLR